MFKVFITVVILFRYVCASLIFLFGAAAHAQPKLIILLRHAEEPSSSSVHLSHRGFKRAKVISHFFRQHAGGLEIGGFYAQGAKNHSSSKRSIETLEPAAKEFNLKIETDYKKGDGLKLAEDLLKDKSLKGKAVVIAWGSDEVGPIARKFGVKFITTALNWDKSIYNRAWLIQLDDTGKAFQFSDVAQHLLKGDKDSSTNSTVIVPPCDDAFSGNSR
ncbi:MAG: histidine phosphatase family protein [Bdellovibrionales bacterium]|nr:histidine phosphatase family protein [Bdellovibrionales bacterium]